MDAVPTPARIRDHVAALSAVDRRVVGSLTILLISEPGRARDREWLAERFTQLAVVAHGFDQHAATDDDVATVEAYARARIGELVGLALAVFVRVAEDLRESGGEPPFGLDDAFARVQGYVGPVDVSPPDA